MYLVRRIWLQPEFSIRVFMLELVWEYRPPENILALRHWRTLGLWTARLLNHGAIGQIKKLKQNFDNFQSCGEIESMHEFEGKGGNI